MSQKKIEETSMTEILKSIREMISDDKNSITNEKTIDSTNNEQVLNLTEMVKEDGTVINIPDKKINETKKTAKKPTLVTENSDFISPNTISKTSKAFAELKEIPKKIDKKSKKNIGEKTLEEVMKDLLKPMLKEWLDLHLPSLVSSIVKNQIEKITDKKY